MEDLKEGGFVVWWRKTLDSQVFLEKPAEWFKLWFYLVMRANWEDGRLPRGSFHIRYRFLQDKLHISRNSIDHFIRYAKGQHMLATRKATRGMVVTVLNYAKYQDKRIIISDSKSDSKATQKRHDKKTSKQVEQEYISSKEDTAAPKSGGDPFVNALITQFQEIMELDQWADSQAQRRKYAHLIGTSRKWSLEQTKAILTAAKSHPRFCTWCKMSDLYYKGVELIREVKSKLQKPNITIIE